MRPRTFRDVVVYPTQEALKPPALLFRGGPDWPLFWGQMAARHCRFGVPIPLDVRPRREGKVVGSEPVGFWCGPVTQHFGHAIASFGTRIACSAVAPGEPPLVFSARPGQVLPPFFHPMLAHLGVAEERVRIVEEPTRFAKLSVFPQAERLGGRPPSEDYLDLLDRLSGPVPTPDGSRLFVSRAALARGRVAGEGYLEDVLTAAGLTVFRPEYHPLADQLAAYRRASMLVFSEGSALHALQLLGWIDATVVVIVRRRGRRMAAAALRPRVRSLHYVDAVRGFLDRRGRSGSVRRSAGIAQIDENELICGLKTLGIDIRQHWDRRAFVERQNVDLREWVHADMR